MASMVAVLLKIKLAPRTDCSPTSPIATVTLGVFGDSASSPWPQSRRAGWPSFGLQTDHIPPSLSPIAITRVSSLASFNILACSSRAGHVIHLGASTNIWNNLPQFPKSYTATMSSVGNLTHRLDLNLRRKLISWL